MDRFEARKRIDAAIAVLRANGSNRMKLTPAGYFWLGYAAVLGLAAYSCHAKGAESVPTFELSDPICPPGYFSIIQRYDEWGRVGGQLMIVKKTPIRKCIPPIRPKLKVRA